MLIWSYCRVEDVEGGTRVRLRLTQTPCASSPSAGQAMACEYLLSNRDLAPGCVPLPTELDNSIAAMQLEALGVAFDVQTTEQVW